MTEAQGNYYLPEPSRWPILMSSGLFILALGFILFMNNISPGGWLMLVGAAIVIAIMYRWFGQVVGESEGGVFNGHVDMSFRMGMGWFIFSEMMFFAAFFGVLFYVRYLSIPWIAETELLWPGFDASWPTAGPKGPVAAGTAGTLKDGQFLYMSAWGIPLINTALLLASSVTVTFAHWALKQNERGKLVSWLVLTVALGFLFLVFQAYEYYHAYTALGLTLGTGVYGATFFMLTGFHGLHVTIGAIILTVILLRCIKGHFKPDHHFGFEAAAWYWHFVDTVWVCLFVLVYVL